MSGFKSIAKHEVTFGLEKVSSGLMNHEAIYTAPRAGLNPHRQPEMHNKMYRYFIYPMKKHEPKGDIIASLRGSIPGEKLKEIFCWNTFALKNN